MTESTQQPAPPAIRHTRLMVRLPASLKAEFGAVAASRGQDMSGIVRELVIDWIEKHQR